MTGRVFPAGTGGNPLTPTLGTPSDLAGTAQPSIRQTPDVVPKTVMPFTDSGVNGFVDGAGNRIWYPDTSATAVAITFVSAAESTDYSYVIKWTNGANPLTVLAASGKVGGTTTFAGVTVGDSYEFRSDGSDYQLVSRVGDFVVSGGPAVLSNLTVGGSSTFSGTVAFLSAASISGSLSVGTLVVSGTASFSATVVVNSLTVLGTATFSATVVFTGMVDVNGKLAVSATASVGAITVGGAPLSSDWKKIGAVALSDTLVATLSGSYTAYTALRIDAYYKLSVSSVADPIMQISSDNGTSYLLTGSVINTGFVGTRLTGNLAVSQISVTFSGNISTINVGVIASNLTGSPKFITGQCYSTNASLKYTGSTTPSAGSGLIIGDVWVAPQMMTTATANAAVINQIAFSTRNGAGTTVTMSSGILYLYGLA